jgi:hypothetical protein
LRQQLRILAYQGVDIHANHPGHARQQLPRGDCYDVEVDRVIRDDIVDAKRPRVLHDDGQCNDPRNVQGRLHRQPSLVMTQRPKIVRIVLANGTE